MQVTLIRVLPVQVFMIYMICVCKHLENNYVKADSVYKYSSASKDCNTHYFIEGIELCFFECGSMMLKVDSAVRYTGLLPIDPIGVLVHKVTYQDPPGYKHRIRVYSNGVVIHTTKLFKYIYRRRNCKYDRRLL